MPASGRTGFSLIELIIVALLLGILAGLAAPSLDEQVRRMRMRATLDELTSDIYRARAHAARTGVRIRIEFKPARGCADAYVLRAAEGGQLIDSVPRPGQGGTCLTANVTQAMLIDSRGMLVGSPRTIRARAGRHADSMTVSIAGRVYRWY